MNHSHVYDRVTSVILEILRCFVNNTLKTLRGYLSDMAYFDFPIFLVDLKELETLGQEQNP